VNYAEEGMQVVKVPMLVSLNLAPELICFLPIGTPINVVQSKAVGGKTIIATKDND
jgi:hypothetical protein